MASPTQDSTQYDFQEAVATRKAAKKKKKAIKIAAIVFGLVLALLLCAAGGLTWFFSSIANNLSLDQQTSEELKGVLCDNVDDPFYTLIIGKDVDDPAQGAGCRSDVIILVRTDPKQHVITLVSIPRDTPYYIDGEKVKINENYRRDGAIGIVTAVQNLTGVPISHYVEIDLNGLVDFVDSLGGITVDIPYAFSDGTYTYQPGGQTITGRQAVTIARTRNVYNFGLSQDAVRQTCDRALVVGLINEVLSLPASELPETVQNLSKCVSTDITLDNMISLAQNFSGSDVTIYTCTGPYDGETDPDTGFWLCYENPAGWHDLMCAVDAGEDPSTSENTIQGR